MHLAEQLRAVGVPCFPCWLRWDQTKGKWLKGPQVPKGENWKTTALRPVSDPVLDWSSGTIGVPIPARIVVLDIDAYKGATRDAIESLLGCSLPWDAALIQNTVSGGQHYAFKCEWPVKQADSLGLDGFDTRVAGKGFICSGKGYSPVGFGIMALGYPDSLPVLPDECRRVLEALPANALPTTPLDDSGADVAGVLELLRHIDPGISRARWFKIGCALKRHFHADEETGLQVFGQWSSGALWPGGAPANYVPEDIPRQWPTFKVEGRNGTATIATIYYEAMAGGWTPPPSVDVAQAFGANPAKPEVFVGLLERIGEEGGDVRHTVAIIEAIQAAGCNSLQVAILAAELKNALKDAGIKDKEVSRHIDQVLSPNAPAPSRPLDGMLPVAGQYLDADTPLHPSAWAPMQTKGKEMKPKGTLSNFDIMLNAYGVSVMFDEIAKRTHITGPTVPGGGVLQEEAALSYLDSLSALNEYPPAQVRSGLIAAANRNTFNPVEQWVNATTWDGRDHIGHLWQQVTLSPDEDAGFCELMFRKWLRGAYAIGTGRLRSWEYVLVLVDPSGGAGKTRFFGTLSPAALFKRSMILDVHERDSIKIAISYWLCELGELDGTFSRSDQNKLKAFLSDEWDELRLPYGRTYMKYPRRTAFIASVNQPLFLLDPSNNRRFWVMQVTGVNHQHTVDIAQVWAQVAAEVAAGLQAHLTPQEDQILFARNDGFRAGSAVADKLSSITVVTGEPTDKLMTTSEILALAGHTSPSKAELNEAADWLRKRGMPYRGRAGKRGFVVTVLGRVEQAFKLEVVK